MQIDVFHDTACPWCRIGKQHLKLALQQWTGEEVTIRYRTFFLNDSIPPEGYDFREYMFAKGGGRVPLEQFFAAPRQAGAAAGLTFNFEQIQYAPNTLLSHRLIALTPDDQKEAVIDAIYDAYFQHGRDIGDLEVLVEIVGQQGLDKDWMREQLLTDTAANEVLAEAQMAQQSGISGVPFFIFNNLLALSGAQPPAVMLKALEQASSKERVR